MTTFTCYTQALTDKNALASKASTSTVAADEGVALPIKRLRVWFGFAHMVLHFHPFVLSHRLFRALVFSSEAPAQ